MSIANRYAVVQFLETPHADIDDYVCVPLSWIRTRRETDQKTTVAYPDEHRSQVEIRIRNCERPSDSWKTYMAIVKYETLSLIDASFFIMEKKLTDSTKKVQSFLSIDESSLLATATEKLNNSIKRIRLSKPQDYGQKIKIIDREAETESTNKTSSFKKQVPSQEENQYDSFSRNNQQSSQCDKHIYHRNLLPSQKNLSNSFPPIQGEFRKTNNVSNSQTGSQGPKRNLLYVSPEPLLFVKKILRDCEQSNESLENSLGNHLHEIQASEGRQRGNILNLRTHSPEIAPALPQQSIKLSVPQLESSRKKIQIIDKTKLIDECPKVNYFPEHVNLKSATLPSDNVFEVIMAEPANVTNSFRKRVSLHESSGRNNRQFCHINNDFTRNHVSRSQTLFDRYNFQGESEKTNKTQISNSRTRSQGPKKNLLKISRDPLILKNQILRDYQQLIENPPSFIANHLNSRAPSERTQNVNIFNHTALSSETSFSKQWVQELEENTSPISLNPSKVAKKSNQVPKSSVYQDRPNVLPMQLTPRQPSAVSDMELHYQKSIFTNSIEHQDSDDQAMAVDESIEESCQGKVIHSQQRTENDIPLIEYQENENESSQTSSLTNKIDFWTNQLSDIFNEMGSNLTDASEASLKIHQKLGQSAKTMDLIKDIFQNIKNQRQNKASLTTKDVTTENGSKDKENQPEIIEEEIPDNNITESNKNSDVVSDKIDDDGDNDDKDLDDAEKETDVPKKIRAHPQIGSFILPHEYDPNDTRWTLKYPKHIPKLGLVELMPRSKVYINAIRLAHCKRMSKDAKTLARMILLEIFSLNALSVCSLTGAKAHAFDSTMVRPGLDENARMVLLSFVEEHARQKNWGKFDSQSVINSIRSKIQEIRAKYGKSQLF